MMNKILKNHAFPIIGMLCICLMVVLFMIANSVQTVLVTKAAMDNHCVQKVVPGALGSVRVVWDCSDDKCK